MSHKDKVPAPPSQLTSVFREDLERYAHDDLFLLLLGASTCILIHGLEWVAVAVHYIESNNKLQPTTTHNCTIYDIKQYFVVPTHNCTIYNIKH